MSDHPDKGLKLTRTEKQRLNRIHHWRGVRDQAAASLRMAEAKLRELGDTPELSRAEPPGDGTSPQK